MSSQILFVMDTTGSMSSYIQSLKPSILQLTQMIMLLGTDTKIGILGYKDHSDMFPIEWVDFCDPKTELEKLDTFVSKIKADGGDDFCEASKTAVNKALDMVKGLEEKTLVIHFTDAAPHVPNEYLPHGSNGIKNNDLEKSRLGMLKKPFDWIEICDKVRNSKLAIVTIYSNSNGTIRPEHVIPYYALLGQIIQIERPTRQSITRTTIDVILSHFNGSTFTSYNSYEFANPCKLSNEVEFGKKGKLPLILPFEYFPKRKVFEGLPSITTIVKRFKENNEVSIATVGSKRTVSQPYRDLVFIPFLKYLMRL